MKKNCRGGAKMQALSMYARSCIFTGKCQYRSLFLDKVCAEVLQLYQKREFGTGGFLIIL